MKKNNFKSLMILMVLSLFIFSVPIAVALNDIPSNTLYSLPPQSSSDSSVEVSSGFFSFLGSLFSIFTDKPSYDIDENIKITLTQRPSYSCGQTRAVINVYQNGDLKHKDFEDIGNVLVTQTKTTEWTINKGTLSEGTYGVLGYLWCADSNQRISPADEQEFSIKSNQCIPQTEVCDNIDNDCDGQIDELNVCSTDCLTQFYEWCNGDKVWFYDSCERPERIKNDCATSGAICKDGRCVSPVTTTTTTLPLGQTTTTTTIPSVTTTTIPGQTTTTTLIIPTNQPYLVEVSHSFETLSDNKIKGTFVLRNDGINMPQNWILEMQVNKEPVVFSFISPVQETCDSNIPSNVHKSFQLDAGETITIVLESTVPDDLILENGNTYVLAVITEECGCTETECYKNPYLAGKSFGQIVVEIQEPGSCVNTLLNEDLKERLFKPTQAEIDTAKCTRSSDCCKVSEQQVGCVREDVFEDTYGIETTGWFRDIWDDDKGICVAKEKNGFDLGFLTDDSIIPNIQNWIIFLAALLILMVIGGRKR